MKYHAVTVSSNLPWKKRQVWSSCWGPPVGSVWIRRSILVKVRNVAEIETEFNFTISKAVMIWPDTVRLRSTEMLSRVSSRGRSRPDIQERHQKVILNLINFYQTAKMIHQYRAYSLWKSRQTAERSRALSRHSKVRIWSPAIWSPVNIFEPRQIQLNSQDDWSVQRNWRSL